MVDRFNVLTPLYYTYVLIVHSIFDKGAFKQHKDYIIGAVGGSSVDDIQKIFESHFQGAYCLDSMIIYLMVISIRLLKKKILCLSFLPIFRRILVTYSPAFDGLQALRRKLLSQPARLLCCWDPTAQANRL